MTFRRNLGLSSRSDSGVSSPTGSHGADTPRAPNLIPFRPSWIRQTPAPTSEELIILRTFLPDRGLDEIQEPQSRLDDLELGTRVFLISCLTIVILFLAAAGLFFRALREGAFG